MFLFAVFYALMQIRGDTGGVGGVILLLRLPVMCTQDLITRSVSLLLYVALVRDILDMTPELPVTRIRTFLHQSEFSSSIISLTFISRYTYLVRIDTRSVSLLLYAF
jgi:hypothetical protein